MLLSRTHNFFSNNLILVKDKYFCILGVIILLCNNPVTPLISELQIRGGIEDNSRIIFNFLNENICCDPSLEPSQRDGSKPSQRDGFNDGSQNMFLR